jgi:hypothetical protein
MSSMNPADQSFAVHLESLLGFSRELETQIGGTTRPSGQLERLLNTPLLLGAFNEAASLESSHAASVAEMHQLLSDVREALNFAQNVTRTVAEGYSRLDADLGAYIMSSGVLNDDPGAPSRSAAPSTATVDASTAGAAVAVAAISAVVGTTDTPDPVSAPEN